jgi:hypothetical protein
LQNIGKTADNPLVIDGKGQIVSEAVKEIILNRKEYDGKFITIKNTYYEQFGISSITMNTSSDDRWFKDNETYNFDAGDRSSYARAISNVYSSNNFYFYFHPSDSDTEARKLMIDMKGRYYNGGMRFATTGIFKISPTGTSLGDYNVFLVTEFSLGDKKYNGILPE